MKFVLLMLCAFFSAAVPAGAAEPFIIVADSWPPYVYEESGVITGFDYEVSRAVLSKLGFSVELRLIPWARCLWMVSNGEADAILDASVTPERRQTMLFPDEKISDSSSVLFYLKGRTYRYSGLGDLKGLRIGTIRGYMYSREIDEADWFVKEPVADIEQNIRKLLGGRIDLFISNRYVGEYSIRKAGAADRIDFLPKPVSGGELYLAFARTGRNVRLVKEFSEALRQFKKSAEFAQIMKRYGH